MCEEGGGGGLRVELGTVNGQVMLSEGKLF